MDDEFEPDFEEEEEEVIGFVNSFLYDNNVADNDNGVEDNDNEMVDNNGVADNDNEVEDIDNEVEDIDNEVADNDNEVEDNNEVADNDNEVEDIDNEVEDNDNEVADNDNEVADNNNEMADNDNDTNDVADTTDTNDDTNDGVVGVLSDDVMKLEKVLQEMYSDIGGLDQQKQQIKESVELPLTHPQYNKEMGIKPPDTNIADIIAEVITQNNQKRTEITKNADSIRPENQLTSLINNKKRTEITKNADLIRPENQLTSKINNNNKIPTVAENPSQHITAQYIGKPFKTVEIDKIYYDKVEKYLLTKTLPTVYGYSTNEEDFIKETRKFKMENGKLYLNKCEVIKDEAMQLQIARESHLMKSNPKRHRTKNQSVRFIEQKYFWGGIGLDVENVYNQCLVCNPIKAQLCQLWKFIEVGIVCENVIIVRDLNKKSQILTCVVLEIITPQSFTELIVPLFLKYGIPDAIRIVKSVVFDRAFVEMFINILRQDLIEVINQMKSLVNLVGDKEFFPKLPTIDVISEVRNSKCPTNEEELDRFKFTESTQTPLYVFHSSKWAVNQSVLETIDKLITDVKSKYNDWKLKLPVISSLFQMCGTNFKCNERIKMEQMDQSKARDNRTKKEADKLKITLKATNARDARDTKKKPIIIDSSTSDSESDSESNCSTKDKMALENDLYLSSSSSSSSSSDENDVIDNNNNNNKSELKFNDKSELKFNDKSELKVTSKVGNVEMNNSNPLFETSEIEKPCSPINDSSVQPEEFQQICQFLQNNFSHSTDTISQPEEQISTKINSDTNNGKPAEHEMLDKSGEREYLIKKYDKNKECKKCVVVLIKYPRKFFIDAIDGKVTDFDKILSQQTQLTEVTENISLKRKPSIDTLSECDLKSSKKLKNSNENEENSSKFINGRHRKSSDVDNAQSSKTIDLLDGTAPSVSSRKRNISGMSNESIESKSSLKSSCENLKRLKSVHMTINIKNKEFNKPKQTKNLNLQSSTKDNVSYNETNKDNSSSSNKLSTNLINMTSLKAINLSESSNSDDSDGDNVSPIKLNLNKTNTIETRPTPRTFKCEQCSFHSNDAHLLLEHKAKHKKLICNECAMIFNSNNDLDEHKAAEHPPNTSESILYGCEKCPHFSGYKMDEIDSHLKDTHIETIGDKFKCSLCKKVFSEKTLADHLLIHRKYKCVFCVFFASKFTELERHGRQKHIEYENYFFRCAYCTEFDSPCFGSLTDHNKTCHAIQYTENGEKCCVCDIVINGSDETHNVLEHLVTHVNQEIYIYKCRFDSTRCNRLDQMTSHCYRYHGSNETKDLCEPFDTTFLFQEILKKLKNRNENAIRKIPNLNETQNAIAALFGDSFQDNYDNEDEENIIHNNDALGNALNIAFSEKNDDENEVPVLSIPNSSSSPEKFVNFYVTDNGLELIDEEQESQEF